MKYLKVLEGPKNRPFIAFPTDIFPNSASIARNRSLCRGSLGSSSGVELTGERLELALLGFCGSFDVELGFVKLLELGFGLFISSSKSTSGSYYF